MEPAAQLGRQVSFLRRRSDAFKFRQRSARESFPPARPSAFTQSDRDFLDRTVRRMARSLEISTLEKLVPAIGVKDAKEKENDLMWQLLRSVDEHRESGQTRMPREGSIRGSQASESQRRFSYVPSPLVSPTGSRPTSPGFTRSEKEYTPAPDQAMTAVQRGLTAILQELKICRSSRQLSISFRDRLTTRRTGKVRLLPNFVKLLDDSISLVQGMIRGAGDLKHGDLALWINICSSQFEQEITSTLLRNSSAGTTSWDMLYLLTSQIMADVRDKWDSAARARNAFESFGTLCVLKCVATSSSQALSEPPMRSPSQYAPSRPSTGWGAKSDWEQSIVAEYVDRPQDVWSFRGDIGQHSAPPSAIRLSLERPSLDEVLQDDEFATGPETQERPADKHLHSAPLPVTTFLTIEEESEDEFDPEPAARIEVLRGFYTSPPTRDVTVRRSFHQEKPPARLARTLSAPVQRSAG